MFSQAVPVLIEFLQWPIPLFLIVGGLVGVLFGIIPGLGGAQLLALLLPVTFSLPQNAALALLVGAMGATATSGSIAAILFNTPGTPQNAATCFDGFPLAKQGKAGLAIGAAVTASMMGAVMGLLVLTLLLPVGREVVLLFSYPEYFMLGILGMSVIAVVASERLVKGLIAASFGLLISMIGYDPITAEIRFTFGWIYLYEGVGLIPMLIGLFAVSESVELMLRGGSIADSGAVNKVTSGALDGAVSVFRNFGLFLRSSVIGTVVGIIPGIGGSVANFVAYGQAVQMARDKSMFGRGDIRGVIAPEASNNAKDGGSLVPTLIFGVPGSLEMAVFLGALTIYNIQPGPRLILDTPEVAIMIIYAMVASNIVAAVASLTLAGAFSRLTRIQGSVMAPVILMVALVGTYVTNGRVEDVAVALVFGIIGFMMRRFGFSVVPLLIAAVLGELIQVSYYQTLLSLGWDSFFTRPISLALLLATVCLIAFPGVNKMILRRRTEKC
jgi:putative tricarboxylic transport membrane protein